jgi:ATP:ADP antiporter, AAA family
LSPLANARPRTGARGPAGGVALARGLRFFAEVRPEETQSSLLLAANVFLLLTTYYLIKPVREALILAGGGAELKSYLSTGQAILLLGLVPLYGSLAGRVTRRRLLNTVTLVFSACLVAFFLLARAHIPVGIAFFLWAGIFNLMIVAQFWGFANDLFSEEAGRRLFPLIAIGASAGAALGSIIAALLIPVVGVYQLLLLAAALLAASLLLTNRVEGRAPRAPAPASSGPEVSSPPATRPRRPGSRGAFRLVWNNRYLLAVAFLMLLVNWVNTNGEYILGRTVREAAARAVANGTDGGLGEGAYIGQFYSRFFSVVNLVGLGAQMFLVSRIVRFLGVRGALMVLPALAFGGYAILAFAPILPVIRWAKTAENAADYSLQNTVRNILFLPTSRDEKYQAKQAIDAFFVRAGDVLSSALVYLGTAVLSLQTRQFALCNLGLTAAWLVLAAMIGRRYLVLSRPAVAEPAPPGPTVRP